MKTKIVLLLLVFLIISCKEHNTKSPKNKINDNVKASTTISSFNSILKTEIMILGSYHFRQEKHYDELSDENQNHIENLISKLTLFKPTKVVVEKEVKYDSLFQDLYKKYLVDEKAIDTLLSETFQLGYKLAKRVGHKKIYLFDNKTEFIGSLENFTWDKFNSYANQYDSGFYDKYKEIINKSYNNNNKYYESLNLYDNITERNSPQSQKWNTERMHLYEVRIGIQDSWIGADWLGRWYQRNIRMMGNVMKFNNSGKDRILIIVGDNHKWILETLFDYNPEFIVNSSYDLLKT